jgi:hypothetical protein
MYKHFFRCGYCGSHVVTFTEESIPVPPARLHGEALDSGALPAITKNTAGTECPGVLSFCSGVRLDAKFTPCNNPQHKGTEQFQPQPEPKEDPEWNDFVQRVDAGWQNFVASGYSPALRGVNNHHEYRLPTAVSRRLQSAQGAIIIGGVTYTISNSLSAGASLHRKIPTAHQIGNIRSYIFHF